MMAFVCSMRDGITTPVATALLPVYFTARDPRILQELRPQPDNLVPEYSARVFGIRHQKRACPTSTGSLNPWMTANPLPNWSITFHSDIPVYGTEYFRDFKQEGLLEYLRLQSYNYDLTYSRDGIPIFKLKVEEYHVSEKGWHLRIDTIWLNEPDIYPIFSVREKCAVCLEDAFMERWNYCNHSFCNGCINQ
jgi:hypothetical protein